MDLLFLSSRVEGLPNVLLETQCVGVPVASTRVGGAPEAVSDGETGLVIDSDDPRILAQRIHEVLRNREWLARAGRAGPEFVGRNFSIREMAQRTLEVYREVTSSGHPGRQ